MGDRNSTSLNTEVLWVTRSSKSIIHRKKTEYYCLWVWGLVTRGNAKVSVVKNLVRKLRELENRESYQRKWSSRKNLRS